MRVGFETGGECAVSGEQSVILAFDHVVLCIMKRVSHELQMLKIENIRKYYINYIVHPFYHMPHFAYTINTTSTALPHKQYILSAYFI